MKSQDSITAKVSKSVIDYTVTEKISKNTKLEENKMRKSKTFHRCTSCKIISNKNCPEKENKENSK